MQGVLQLAPQVGQGGDDASLQAAEAVPDVQPDNPLHNLYTPATGNSI